MFSLSTFAAALAEWFIQTIVGKAANWYVTRESDKAQQRVADTPKNLQAIKDTLKKGDI